MILLAAFLLVADPAEAKLPPVRHHRHHYHHRHHRHQRPKEEDAVPLPAVKPEIPDTPPSFEKLWKDRVSI